MLVMSASSDSAIIALAYAAADEALYVRGRGETPSPSTMAVKVWQ